MLARIGCAVGILGIFAIGMNWVSASQNRQADTLTTQDYIDIQQLYMAYTQAIDFGEPNGHDYAAVFTPDGVFALVIPIPTVPDDSSRPAASPAPTCPTTPPWHVGTQATIRGSIPDKAGLDVCIATLNGSDDLATMAKGFHETFVTTTRHIYTNLRITPHTEGAHGFVYFNQLDVSTKPPTNTGSGIYEDTLVKTVDGWRFKKRVHTHDCVAGWHCRETRRPVNSSAQ